MPGPTIISSFTGSTGTQRSFKMCDIPHATAHLVPRNMTTTEKLEALLNEAAELPDDAQTELVRSLVEMRVGSLPLDFHDDD